MSIAIGDGGRWTEHVASQGRQATDTPVTESSETGPAQASDVLDTFDFTVPLLTVECRVNGTARQVRLWWDRVEWQKGQPLDLGPVVEVGTAAARRSHIVKSSARNAVESVLPAIPGAGLAAGLIADGVTRSVAAGINAGLPALTRGVQRAAGAGSDQTIILKDIEGVTNQAFDRRVRIIEIRKVAGAGKKPTSFTVSADEAATFHKTLLDAIEALPRREAAALAARKAAGEESVGPQAQPGTPERRGLDFDNATAAPTQTKLLGPVLYVEQRAKLKERHAEYDIYDENTALVGTARQTGQRSVRVVDAGGRELLTITERSGAFRVKSEIVVHDAQRSEIGRIVQTKLGLLNDFHYSLESGDRTLATLSNERRSTRRFCVRDTTEAEVARITNTPKGDSTDRYTKADNYTLQFSRPLIEPLYSLVLAAVFFVDSKFHQGEPEELPARRGDRKQVRRDIKRQAQ